MSFKKEFSRRPVSKLHNATKKIYIYRVFAVKNNLDCFD